jgi:hypothetical protein
MQCTFARDTVYLLWPPGVWCWRTKEETLLLRTRSDVTLSYFHVCSWILSWLLLVGGEMKASRQCSMPPYQQNLHRINWERFTCDSLLPKSRSLECEEALSNMACLGTCPTNRRRKVNNINWGLCYSFFRSKKMMSLPSYTPLTSQLTIRDHVLLLFNIL